MNPPEIHRTEIRPGWRGQAVPEAMTFDFAALPWRELNREGATLERKAPTGEAGEAGIRIQCVKTSNSRRVLRIEDGRAFGLAAEGPVYAKRYLMNTARRRITSRLTGTKAVREFHLGYDLLQRNIPTPVPLAWALHGTPAADMQKDPEAGSPAKTSDHPGPASYLLTREWPNQGSLRDVAPARSSPELWDGVARFLAAAHARGFYHDDCSAEHILVAADAEFGEPFSSAYRPSSDALILLPFAFIDIDNGRLTQAPVSRRRRLMNLFQVLRSVKLEHFPSQERMRFLERYLHHADLVQRLSAVSARRRIDALARRKISRSVFE